MRSTTLLAIALNVALAGPLAAQEKSFEWQPANDESVRLDPANYHTGRTYHPGPNGGGIHVDIDAQQPITIFLTGEAEWQRALQDLRVQLFSHLQRLSIGSALLQA